MTTRYRHGTGRSRTPNLEELDKSSPSPSTAERESRLILDTLSYWQIVERFEALGRQVSEDSKIGRETGRFPPGADHRRADLSYLRKKLDRHAR